MFARLTEGGMSEAIWAIYIYIYKQHISKRGLAVLQNIDNKQKMQDKTANKHTRKQMQTEVVLTQTMQ